MKQAWETRLNISSIPRKKTLNTLFVCLFVCCATAAALFQVSTVKEGKQWVGQGRAGQGAVFAPKGMPTCSWSQWQRL